MEEEEIEKSEGEVKEMLELQLTEVEMLASMFPNPGEFSLDESGEAVKHIQLYLDEQIDYQCLHRIGFTITLPKENTKADIEVVCRFPHRYPKDPPDIFTRTKLSNTQHRKFNEALHEYIQTLERGELCMYSIIQWIQENIENFSDTATVEKETKVICYEPESFTRMWIYSHHIYSKFKRRDLLDWASDLKLTGFTMPGKPGIIVIEGCSRNVEEFWNRCRRMTWKKIAMKDKDDFDVSGSIDDLRKFPNFEEKNFEARGGKGREFHMDLGIFYQFLEERGLGSKFSLFFGVEGHAKSGVDIKFFSSGAENSSRPPIF